MGYDVSVIIPCYNYGQYVGEAVDSVLAQDMPVELLVVNDGSTDQHTLRVLDRLAGDSRVQVIHKVNEGLSKARNTGIERSTGEFLVCLDADDLIQPSYCSSCLNAFRERPGVGFVYSTMQVFGEEQYLWSDVPFSALALLADNYVPCASMFRRRVWEEAGGFCETMKLGYEDWDFWLSVVEKGWHGYHLPGKLFWYRKHGKTMLTYSHMKRKELKRLLRQRHPGLYSFGYVGRMMLKEKACWPRFLQPLVSEHIIHPILARLKPGGV
jgi:glycosyltransferase involved in cell wall biosynthesis